MTSTRIELAFNKIARLNDASDLAELLFPGNRNQQHAFLVIWFSLKWETPGLVPNLNKPAQEYGISRRTLERVRAKLRRLGLIDHVSRFNARHAYREGWVLSPRFEHALRQLPTRSPRSEAPEMAPARRTTSFCNWPRRAGPARPEPRRRATGLSPYLPPRREIA